MSNDHTLIYEVRAALEGPGCAICQLSQRTLQRYLSALANEGVTDRQQRDRIRASYGFCAAHGRMVRSGRDALGSAIIHRDMVNNLSKALAAEVPKSASAGLRIRRVLRPGEPDDSRPLPTSLGCVACEQVRESEQRYASALIAAMAEEQTCALFERSVGLCVPHLRLALRCAPDSATHTALRVRQGVIWQRLLDELDEFIRKQDHRFRHEPSGGEADSWRRAIDLVSGQPECDGGQ